MSSVGGDEQGPRAGRSAAERRAARGPVLLVVGAVVLVHAAALHANILRYVPGDDVRGFDLGAQTEWWWGAGPGPPATWLIGSTAFAAAAGCAVLLAGRSRVNDLTSQERITAGAP